MNSEIDSIIKNIEKIIVGKRESIIKVLCAMLSEGHILIEDVPGVGKTRLVSALSSSVGGKFNRIQLTPDIMPSDIVGFSMINNNSSELEYRQGAAMCNFLLADEINRASPKTQSSLLEIMEERQISLDGNTFPLPRPFMLLATQNPVETYGTYHLPEAQMDRFMMKISMGYPSAEEELDIISRSEEASFSDELSAVTSPEKILEHISEANKVHCNVSVKKYIVDILNATRSSRYVKVGASPRAGIACLRAAKAYAYIYGRDYVSPDDIRSIAFSVIPHRLILAPNASSIYKDAEELMKTVLLDVPVPIN